MYDVVRADDIVATLYSSDESKLSDSVEIFCSGIELEKGNEAVFTRQPVLQIIKRDF